MSPRAATGRRRWLAATALLSLMAVGAAVFTQQAWDMLPCPWCVLQRLIFVTIAVVALLGLAWPAGGAVAVIALALAGIASALWQHFVAASSASCDLTLADRIVGATGLDARLPDVFMAMSSCADAKVDLAGVPYEFWSLGVFVVVAALAVKSLLGR